MKLFVLATIFAVLTASSLARPYYDMGDPSTIDVEYMSQMENSMKQMETDFNQETTVAETEYNQEIKYNQEAEIEEAEIEEAEIEEAEIEEAEIEEAEIEEAEIEEAEIEEAEIGEAEIEEAEIEEAEIEEVEIEEAENVNDFELEQNMMTSQGSYRGKVAIAGEFEDTFSTPYAEAEEATETIETFEGEVVEAAMDDTKGKLPPGEEKQDDAPEMMMMSTDMPAFAEEDFEGEMVEAMDDKGKLPPGEEKQDGAPEMMMMSTDMPPAYVNDYYKE